MPAVELKKLKITVLYEDVFWWVFYCNLPLVYKSVRDIGAGVGRGSDEIAVGYCNVYRNGAKKERKGH